MVDAWPTEVPHGAVEFEQIGGARTGGAFGGLSPATGESSGGPHWRATITRARLRTAAQINAARALEGRLDGGAGVVLVPTCDRHLAPQDPAGAPMLAEFAGPRAADEREIVVNLSGGYKPLLGGEHFSVEHGGDVGRRLYRIDEVTGGTVGGPELLISPALRAAVDVDTVIDFLSPSCPMRLEGGFDLAVVDGRFVDLEATFVEHFEESPANPPAGLGALSLSPDVVASGAVADVLVGFLSGMTAGSTIVLTDTAGGRFKVVDEGGGVWAIYTDAVATDFDVSPAHTITAREALGAATRDSDLVVSVASAVDSILATLELVNPGFEMGDLTGWTQTNPFAVATASGSLDAFAAQAGTYMGAMGKQATATLSQTFTLDASLWPLIDGGHVYLDDFAAYSRNFSLNADHGALFVRFSNGSAQELARACSDPVVSAGAWAAVAVAAYPVPAGTRVIQVGCVGVRDEGDDLDSYWDSFANPTLRQSGQIVEPISYEGPFTPANWVNDEHVVSTITGPIGGNVSIWALQHDGECHKDVSLPADWLATVDAGDAEIFVSVLQASLMDRDWGVYRVQFLDAVGATMGAATSSNGGVRYNGLPVGTQAVIDLAIPAGARKVRIILRADQLFAGHTETYFSRTFVAIKRDA